MNFQKMMENHRAMHADVTIAGMPVDRETAKAMGIMRLEDSGRVAGFLEKPQTDKEMDLVRMEPSWIDARGVPSRGRDCVASMGIYLFERDVLVDMLTKTDYHDFGREIFPAAVRTHKVMVDLFDGYWEDIGIIRFFYETNLALAQQNPPFDLASREAPIYTRARFLPSSRFDSATIKNSLVADGCFVGEGTIIENSIVGLRTRIGKNVNIRNSVLMGADFFAHAGEARADGPLLGIGDGTLIEGAIIDKNVHIGRNVRIANDQKLTTSEETTEALIADGFMMIQKGAVLPDGWKFDPQPPSERPK